MVSAGIVNDLQQGLILVGNSSVMKPPGKLTLSLCLSQDVSMSQLSVRSLALSSSPIHPTFALTWRRTVNTGASLTWSDYGFGACVVQKEEEGGKRWVVHASMCTLRKAIPFPHLHFYEFISSWSYCGTRSRFHHRMAPLTPVKTLCCLSPLFESL